MLTAASTTGRGFCQRLPRRINIKRFQLQRPPQGATRVFSLHRLQEAQASAAAEGQTGANYSNLNLP